MTQNNAVTVIKCVVSYKIDKFLEILKVKVMKLKKVLNQIKSKAK